MKIALNTSNTLAPTRAQRETGGLPVKGVLLILGIKFVHKNIVSTIQMMSIVIYNAALFFIAKPFFSLVCVFMFPLLFTALPLFCVDFAISFL